MKTKPLRPIRETPEGVGISVEFMNDIIDRIEDLIVELEKLKKEADATAN